MKESDMIRLAALILVLIAALVYPIKKILSFECPETPPREFRFRCEGFDPYDPFRGRYIRVRPIQGIAPADSNEQYQYGQTLYAVLAVDKDGFATVTRLTDKLPAKEPFVKVRVQIQYDSASGRNRYVFDFPFDRYYLNENIAPDAEKIVQEATLKSGKDCVIVVLIYSDGSYAVKDLLIKGKPLRDVVKDNPARKT